MHQRKKPDSLACFYMTKSTISNLMQSTILDLEEPL